MRPWTCLVLFPLAVVLLVGCTKTSQSDATSASGPVPATSPPTQPGGVSTKKADATFTAVALNDALAGDDEGVRAKYKDKWIEVSGTVSSAMIDSPRGMDPEITLYTNPENKDGESRV